MPKITEAERLAKLEHEIFGNGTKGLSERVSLLSSHVDKKIKELKKIVIGGALVIILDVAMPGGMEEVYKFIAGFLL